MRGDLLLLSMRGDEPADLGGVQVASWTVPEDVEEEESPTEEEEKCSAAAAPQCWPPNLQLR